MIVVQTNIWKTSRVEVFQPFQPINTLFSLNIFWSLSPMLITSWWVVCPLPHKRGTGAKRSEAQRLSTRSSLMHAT
jgi:hypothetical protein